MTTLYVRTMVCPRCGQKGKLKIRRRIRGMWRGWVAGVDHYTYSWQDKHRAKYDYHCHLGTVHDSVVKWGARAIRIDVDWDAVEYRREQREYRLFLSENTALIPTMRFRDVGRRAPVVFLGCSYGDEADSSELLYTTITYGDK